MVAAMEGKGPYTLSQFMVFARNEQQEAELAKWFAGHKLDPYSVAMSLPAHEAILRKFSVQVAASKDLGQIVHYAAEPHIATRPIEELSVAYHVLQRQSGSVRLLVGAVATEMLTKTIAEVEVMGIYPPGIVLDVLALAHAARVCQLIPDNEMILILDVHSDFVNSVLVGQQQLGEVRSLPLKVRSILDAMGADPAETTEINLNAVHDEVITSQRQMKIWEKLAKEVRRTCFASTELKRIYVCGEPELIEGLPGFLEKQLGLAVVAWDVSAAFTVNPDIARSLWPLSPVALGLALLAGEATPGTFNFRQGKLACVKTWDIVKRPLIFALAGVLWLVVIFTWWSLRILQEEQARYRELLTQANSLYARVNPAQDLAQVADHRKIVALLQWLEDQLNLPENHLPALPDNFARLLTVLEQVGKVRKTHYFTIDRLSLQDNELLLDGKCESDVCLDALKAIFKKTGLAKADDDSVQTSSKPGESGKNPKLGRRFHMQVYLR